MSETRTAEQAADVIARRLCERRQLPPPSMRRALREAAGLTTTDLASAIGVTRQAIGKWERGLRTPRGAHLNAYVAVLNSLAASPSEDRS